MRRQATTVRSGAWRAAAGAALAAWGAAWGMAAEALPRRVGGFVQRVPIHRELPAGLPAGFVPARVWRGADDGRPLRLCRVHRGHTGGFACTGEGDEGVE